MEIKDYLPKRIQDRVVRVDIDADFDYEKIEAFNIILLFLTMEQDSMPLQSKN